jgi:hypothetical protein
MQYSRGLQGVVVKMMQAANHGFAILPLYWLTLLGLHGD